MSTPAALPSTGSLFSRLVLSGVLAVLIFMSLLVGSLWSGKYWVLPGGATAVGLLLALWAFWRSRVILGFALAVALVPLVMEGLTRLGIEGQNLTLLSIGATIALYAACIYTLLARAAARRAQRQAEQQARSAHV